MRYCARDVVECDADAPIDRQKAETCSSAATLSCFVEKERIWYGEESRNFVATRFQSAFFFQYGKNTDSKTRDARAFRVPPLVASRVSSSPRRRSREESRRGEPFARVSLPAASRVAFPSRRPRASRFPRQIPAEGSSLAR